MRQITEESAARFWSYVGPPASNPCRHWLKPGKHRRFRLAGEMRPVTAAAWILMHGSKPLNKIVLHACPHSSCVIHLTLDTRADAVRRVRKTDPGGANKAQKVKCPNGHLYTEANVYRKADGYRRCRTCNRLSTRRRRARAKRLEGLSPLARSLIIDLKRPVA